MCTLLLITTLQYTGMPWQHNAQLTQLYNYDQVAFYHNPHHMLCLLLQSDTVAGFLSDVKNLIYIFV